ncbi:MAG: DegT/DnrJ/EryC1/StrS aminotransferase family protein [Bacteroidales bacterium]|nr:DegT/DnrJ/EryC1/StrS aminotransferase family protein [Bacteroidales bacterium]
MKIPFSPPHIDDAIIDEVVATLRSGWITTGPRTKLFEQRLAEYCGIQRVVCVNSASAGLELVLHWFGVGQGDEVIIPAYTYTATAAVVLHCGAKPVMVDVNDELLMDVEQLGNAITPRTKAIIPVDIVGLPCDYDRLLDIIQQPSVRQKFHPDNPIQEKLGRILILSDAAHSLGAHYKGKKTGALTDISVFSFHAVKNLTTAEGGAICFNLPVPFNLDELYHDFCIYSLHGQSKDAFTKTQAGSWRYDVRSIGHKCNMTDIAAAMGLVELARYDQTILPRRKKIFDTYREAFQHDSRFQTPVYETDEKRSSYHVFTLFLNHATEQQRDEIIQKIAEFDVATNVHFIPLPMLTAYKSLGYRIEDYPNAYRKYACEISLPVYFNLTDEQVEEVIRVVKTCVPDNCAL